MLGTGQAISLEGCVDKQTCWKLNYQMAQDSATTQTPGTIIGENELMYVYTVSISDVKKMYCVAFHCDMSPNVVTIPRCVSPLGDPLRPRL